VVQDVRLNASRRAARGASGARTTGSQRRGVRLLPRLDGHPQAEFEKWIDNGYAWAEKFKGFKFENKPSLPTSFYPRTRSSTRWSLIKKHGRMDWSKPEYVERLKSEIDLLHQNGTIDLLPYFFIDEEVCSLYEKNGLLTGPGRGSAAGLLLTYLLGITHVDPLRYRLSRDRFITLDRIAQGKLPDIDQDLPSRELLPEGKTGWLSERFVKNGRACYAQISVDTTMKLKSAIKDCCRAMFGNVSEEIAKLCKKLPMPPQGISDRDFVFGYKANDEWIEGASRRTRPSSSSSRSTPRCGRTCRAASASSGRRGATPAPTRSPTTPSTTIMPLALVGDVPVTEYPAPSVESSGVLKMDFLSSRRCRTSPGPSSSCRSGTTRDR
jgi:DNA polymerase-3 subunit alpha